MKPNPLALIALGFALMLCGCTLFNDDFDDASEATGAPPRLTPPGPPTGDLIRLWNPDPGNLVVVADGINGNGLIHSYQREVSQADFIGKDTGRNPQEYWARWTARAERFSSATPRFFFSVGNFDTGIANLEIDNGEYFCSGERLGGVVLDQDHSIRMHVDNRAGTYDVTISQTTETARRAACPDGRRFEGGACESRSGFPTYARSHCRLEDCGVCRADEVLDTTTGTCVTLTTRSFNCTDRPLGGIGHIPGYDRLSIVMSYDNLVASDPASYIIDDIHMNE